MDREEAGQKLARALMAYRGDPDAVVLALPRGGVPVAYEVAVRLELPLDVFLVRKLGVPGHEEVAFGAVGSGGAQVLNDDIVQNVGNSREAIEEVQAREFQKLQDRKQLYARSRPEVTVAGKTVLLVDDGLATGATMRVSVKAVRELDPDRVVVAVPVAPPSVVEDMRTLADDVVCLKTPSPFRAVGAWYLDFAQTTDQRVIELLKRAKHA